MKSMVNIVNITSYGEADVPGIDYGPLEFFHEENGYLVLKNRSHLTWSGRGQRRSVTGQLLVFKIISKQAGDTLGLGTLRYEVEGVITIPIRQTQFLAAQGGAADKGGKKVIR